MLKLELAVSPVGFTGPWLSSTFCWQAAQSDDACIEDDTRHGLRPSTALWPRKNAEHVLHRLALQVRRKRFVLVREPEQHAEVAVGATVVVVVVVVRSHRTRLGIHIFRTVGRRRFDTPSPCKSTSTSRRRARRESPTPSSLGLIDSDVLSYHDYCSKIGNDCSEHCKDDERGAPVLTATFAQAPRPALRLTVRTRTDTA